MASWGQEGKERMSTGSLYTRSGGPRLPVLRPRKRRKRQDLSRLSFVRGQGLPQLRRVLERIQEGQAVHLRRGGAAWCELLELGVRGDLIRFRQKHLGKGRPGSHHFVSWPQEQLGLLAGTAPRHAVEFYMETLLFGLVGFHMAWCEHGKHWYFTDDRRRKDCLDHRKAGQQARWWNGLSAEKKREFRRAWKAVARRRS